LILAKIDASFHGQMYYGQEMEVRTYIGRIGSSSFDVYQELWQSNELCASGTAVMVHYDYIKQETVKIPSEIRENFKRYLKV